MDRSMIAVYPARAGGPDALELGSRPAPAPRAGQVLIHVDFAGVNRHDCNQRQRGKPPAGATDILGLEVAGEIAACGEGVEDMRVGARVCALVNGGGYAEFVAADAELALPVPQVASLETAAALPEALFTSWHNLVEICGLQSGETLLVHGGASGVGSMAIQLGRLLGARVLATAGDDARCAFARSQGATHCFNYRTQDFVAGAMEATGGRGADVILDMAGGLYAERNLQALARRGRIAHLSSGQEPVYAAPLALIMQKEARVTGSLLRPLERERKALVARRLREIVWPEIGRSVAPAIHKIFALQDAAAAHAEMEAGANMGKILLRVAGAR